jgi:hypothetical protein
MSVGIGGRRITGDSGGKQGEGSKASAIDGQIVDGLLVDNRGNGTGHSFHQRWAPETVTDSEVPASVNLNCS